MKHTVSTKQPYGDWLAKQTATLQDIVAAAPQDMLADPPIVTGVSPQLNGYSNGDGNGAAANGRGQQRERQWPCVTKGQGKQEVFSVLSCTASLVLNLFYSRRPQWHSDIIRWSNS